LFTAHETEDIRERRGPVSYRAWKGAKRVEEEVVETIGEALQKNVNTYH
jgi:hypothetical protein